MRLLKRLFKKRTPTVEMKKYLIVGLGNIGEEYQNTRHNIGFQILDHLAEKNQLSWEVKKLGSYSSLKVKGRQFILIKPNTYMNRSGKSVRYWALQEKIPLENILIATDELHLPFGSVRLRAKGSPAGHNGLKDVEAQLNTPHYSRLRFGIGQEQKAYDQVKFVLDPWDKKEEDNLTKIIEKCTDAIICFGLEGINAAMNKFNGSN